MGRFTVGALLIAAEWTAAGSVHSAGAEQAVVAQVRELLARQASARCNSFCDTIVEVCTGEDECFGTKEQCMAECAGWDQGGAKGEVVGNNTLHCRQFYLDVVRKVRSPRGICDYACSGGGMCDNSVPLTCDGYCRHMVQPGGDCGEGPFLFDTPEQCAEACNTMSDGPLDTLRDTLQCRVLFINIGEQSQYPRAKEELCPQAGATVVVTVAEGGIGKAYCVGSGKEEPAAEEQCETYCSWMAKFCPADLHPTASATDAAECKQKCLALPRSGAPGDATGNTLQCRMKFVAVAARSTLPEIHCAHDMLCVDGGGAPAGYAVLDTVAAAVAERMKSLEERLAAGSGEHEGDQQEMRDGGDEEL